MKKVLCLLVLLVLVVGCQFNKNPFLGTWRANLASLASFNLEPGDYWLLMFYDDDTFDEEGQIESVPYLLRGGSYDYTDTVLELTYKGGLKVYITYAFLEEEIMVWYEPITIHFYRQ